MRGHHLINDDYNNNNNMNSVDRADQMREVYKFDRWLRQRKWWWSIFLWFLGVSVVTAYEIYKAKCREEDKPPMSDYKFQEMGALAWIAPVMIEGYARMKMGPTYERMVYTYNYSCV